MKTQHVLLAAALTMAPFATAMAQSYGPMIGADNTREAHEVARGSAPPVHHVQRDTHHGASSDNG